MTTDSKNKAASSRTLATPGTDRESALSSSSLRYHTSSSLPPIRSVAFVHLDLGIGGAEQLIVQLATVTQKLIPDGNLTIYTTRCDPTHCFAAVQPAGHLHPCLRVYGPWIPQNIAGKLRVLCSTLRLLYLAVVLILRVHLRFEPAPDIIVLDVLPAPLMLWKWLLPQTSLLFYCHFPDALLKQQTNAMRRNNTLRQLYRTAAFQLEQACLLCADRVVVNSLFTQQTVRKTFIKLSQTVLPVVYPALQESRLDDAATNQSTTDEPFILSLNRYERKKNIGLLLEAVAWMRNHDASVTLPRVVIAGGYDTRCVENVEHRAELQQLARDLQLDSLTSFRQSISDDERAQLLHTALAVVYTPHEEHFGIVPLEAMQAGTPVLAVKSGGPQETILHGETGFLCENIPASFARALLILLRNPSLSQRMGRAGREHVQATFGMDRLQEEWATQLQETHALGWHRRMSRQYRVGRGLVYLVEAAMILLLLWVVTLTLRAMSVLEPQQSILDKIFRSGSDEL